MGTFILPHFQHNEDTKPVSEQGEEEPALLSQKVSWLGNKSFPALLVCVWHHHSGSGHNNDACKAAFIS